MRNQRGELAYFDSAIGWDREYVKHDDRTEVHEHTPYNYWVRIGAFDYAGNLGHRDVLEQLLRFIDRNLRTTLW